MNEPPGNDPQAAPPQARGVISDAESSHVQEEEVMDQQEQELGQQQGPQNPFQQHQHDVPPAAAAAFAAPHPLQDHSASSHLVPPPPPLIQGHDDALVMAQFYEARMRDHAAAYASAAAGAAWAAARVAAAAAEFAVGNGPPPPSLGAPIPPPWNVYHGPPLPPPQGGPYAYAPPWLPPPEQGNPDFPPYREQWQQQQQQQQYPQYPKQPPILEQDEAESSSDHGDPRRRRKRQQRLPPDESSGPHNRTGAASSSTSTLTALSVPAQVLYPNQQQTQQSRGKIRRRLRSDGDSSSDGSSFVSRRSFHNKKKARSDESLLGKTAVAALYEWCSKRQRTPEFILSQETEGEFDFTVLEDSVELGHGRARTKVAAKQEAARRALQALVPGVLFDEATGILLQLPRQRGRTESAASLEELAPNLAKRLAIGRDDDLVEISKADSKKKRFKISAQQVKRVRDVYPGTSTTSEDEDENSYYASRGASVCSVLLHAMVQIDSRIQAPHFTTSVAPLPASSSQASQLVSKAASSAKAVAHTSTRGSFTCTAIMKLRSTLDREGLVRGRDKGDATDSASDASDTTDAYAQSQEETLKAVGVGGTKRESRHVASAKLLALLFPDCKDMVEVKAAAEAAKESYAVKKALKQRATAHTSQRRSKEGFDRDDLSGEDTFAAAFAMPNDPPFPSQLQQNIRKVLGKRHMRAELLECDAVDDETRGATFSANVPPDSIFRQTSRRKLLDEQVESALQIFNDRDEEGRSLPDELTVDDVGRTVLRRAEPEDLLAIRKLFAADSHMQTSSTSMGPISILGTGEKNATGAGIGNYLASRLWSQSCVVLLLCRAIAAYEDPPLGCAVLTLGFSIDRGSVLRLAEIASETHLPRERFIECLAGFSKCMKRGLELKAATQTTNRLDANSLASLVESFLASEDEELSGGVAKAVVGSLSDAIKRVSSPLQSVQEESEASDSSAVDHRHAKRSSKPSKRSRVK